MDKSLLYAKALFSTVRNAEDSEVPKIFERFASAIKRRREEYLLTKILKHLSSLSTENTDTTISSAHPLSEHLKKQAISFLKNKFPGAEEKNILFETDSKLIGGVTIRHRDHWFDGSLEGEVTRLKKMYK